MLRCASICRSCITTAWRPDGECCWPAQVAVGWVPAAMIASPCSAAMREMVWRRLRSSLRAFATSTWGVVTTSICDCRSSP
jgi:hypothetical protein